ncbi:unnamed protein product, partial [marine sediment metagenome]
WFQTEDVRVAVAFFDRDTEKGTIHPTRAAEPEDALEIEGLWRENQERTVSAAFIVPTDFREMEAAEFGSRLRYYGYVIRVYYRYELQDQAANPESLLDAPRLLHQAFEEAL